MKTVDEIMEQAQVFASAWSLVGGRFDKGGMLAEAEEAKAELRQMVEAALKEREAPPKAQPMSEALLNKVANGGPVYAPNGIVSRKPDNYRAELKGRFKAGFRAAERHHKIGD